MATYGLGIDIGTTYTAAAVRMGDRVEIVRLGNRRPEVPSLVFIGAGGEVLIGESAQRRGAAEPDRLARDFLGRIADQTPILVGGAPYSAYALTARLLAEVLAVVEGQLGGRPSAVTVTHPADWGADRRETLHQAVRLAGLEEVTFLPEAQAVAVRYAAREHVQPGEIVAVYDLGGTSFHVAVLRRTGIGFATLGQPDGIGQLGGATFDQAVYDHVLAALGPAAAAASGAEAAAGLARLRRDCVEAKEALSFDTEVTVPVALPGVPTAGVPLSRAQLEGLIGPALADTVGAVRRALGSAGVRPTELRAILLAGGSSRIPFVGQLLGTEFGRPVARDPHPEHAIALGAALVTGAVDAPAGMPGPVSVPVPVVVPAGPTEALAPGPALPRPVASGFPISRRTLLIVVPSLALVSAAGGVAAGLLTRETKPPAGSGPSPEPNLGFGTRPSAQLSPVPDPGRTVPTDTMLVRLDESGAWPSTSRSDIYSTTPGSGRRTRLAAGGFDILPQWSHDRRRVAFTRRAGSAWQVWTMNADGSQQTRVTDIAAGTRVAWSPDDRRLAFMRPAGGRPQLFVITLGESTPVQVTNTPDTKDDPAWSPRDPNVIALWSDRDGRHEIFVVRLDRPQDPWQKLTSGSSSAEDPSWSPDGTRLAYTRAGDIWLVGADGSGNRAVTSGRDFDMDPTWSPDGGWIAFTRGPSQGPSVHIVRPDGTGLRKLTVGNAREGHASWS